MLWNRKGATLTEALVTISIAGIIASLGAIGVSRNYLDLSTAAQELLSDLRGARMEATRRGAHYRVALGSESYQTERMSDEDGNGIWEDDTSGPARQIALPPHVSLDVENAQAGTMIEFNSRGMVIGEQGEIQDEVIEIVLTDSDNDQTMQIRVWPSGQIQVDRPSAPAP